MSKVAKGHTLYICFGNYAGWMWEWNKRNKRIVLGRMSIAWTSVDIEVLVDKLIDKIDNLKKHDCWETMADVGVKRVLIPKEHHKALSKSYGSDSDIVKMHTKKGIIEVGRYHDNMP